MVVNPQVTDAVNAITTQLETTRSGIFFSGWRALMGWICDITLAFIWIPQAILGTYMWVNFSLEAHKILPYPMSDAMLIGIITTLLGHSVMRGVELHVNAKK